MKPFTNNELKELTKHLRKERKLYAKMTIIGILDAQSGYKNKRISALADDCAEEYLWVRESLRYLMDKHCQSN